MLTCPLLVLSAVDRGQHGQHDWSAAMQPHTQQTVMHCVFWHLSIRTSINLLSNLSYSSSVGSDHTGQPSLPTCINEPWPPMTLTPVHHCSFLGPLLINTAYCRPGTPHKSCSFGDALTQSSITVWSLSNLLKSLRLPIFPVSNTSVLRTKCSLAA